ncbi:hypothetical protein ABFS82_13G113000 [Erythranthe guttata]
MFFVSRLSILRCICVRSIQACLAEDRSTSSKNKNKLETGAPDSGFSKWFDRLSKLEKEAADRRKLVSKWHPTTKSTFR